MKATSYRELEGQELIDAVSSIIEENGWTPLNSNTPLHGECAYDGDKLVGFNIFQLFPLVGPMWVDEDYRGSGVPESLALRTIKFMDDVQARGYLVIADNPFTAKLCERYGMKRVESPVYMK